MKSTIICAGLSAALCPLVVGAATCTWTGGSSGIGANSDWSTAANWDNCGGAHAVPVNGDTLAFPDGTPRLTNNNDLIKLIATQLLIGGGINVSGNAIGLSGGLVADVPALAAVSPTIHLNVVLETNPQTFSCTGGKSLTLDGTTNLNSQQLTVNGSCNMFFNGKITGSGGITKNGSAVMFIDSGTASDYTGVTTVNGGSLDSSKGFGAAGPGNDTIVNSGASLTLQTATTTSEDISLAGIGVVSSGALKFTPVGRGTIAGAMTLIGSATVAVISLNGTLALTGDIGGGFTLTKIGSGTLAQEGMSGSLEIASEGTLEIDGTVDGVGIAALATLAGTGVSTDAITPLSGGFIAPGPSASTRPGTLSATSLPWNSGAVMQFQLGATSLASDHLVLSNVLSKPGAGNFSFAFSDASTPPTPGVAYSLITFASQNGFSADDFSFTYDGIGPGFLMTGTFALTSTELSFTPNAVVSDLVFRDDVE